MSNIDNSLKEIGKLNDLQQRNQWLNNIHPLVKLLLTVIYILLVVSVDKYNLGQMLVLAIYPFMVFNIGDLRLKEAIYRMRLILPLVMMVGIFNPMFDSSIEAGIISMVTLMLKGIYTVMVAYALIATTSIEAICYALRQIYIPQILVVVILLIYRYIFIMGQEADRIMTAYKLRAPAQKGINYKAWGSLIGQWLIRSMDRAESVYESMQLRGFRGEYTYANKAKIRLADILYLIIWIGVFAVLRFTDIVDAIGGLFI